MKDVFGGSLGIVGSLLLGAAATAAPRFVPAPAGAPAVSPPAATRAAHAAPSSPYAESVAPASASAVADDPEMQRQLDRLNVLSEVVARGGQAADIWRTQLEQAEVLMKIAERSKPDEAENWLRMAVDSYYGAAIQSPANDVTASKQLAGLPERIAAEFPKSPSASYAALQVVQADYAKAVARDGAHPDVARAQLHNGLLHFAKAYPKAPETPKAVMDAAEISESLGQTDNARICYRYLLDNFAGQPIARQAGAALGRIGFGAETVRLELPLLFAPQAGDHTFDLKELRGKLVAVYFWSSAVPGAAADLQMLKDLAVKYQDGSFEVVYVNMDDDQDRARVFLAGKLTVGTHVYQAGGLEGPLAERYGIQAVPQVFLIGRDGTLIRQGMQASQVGAEVSGQMPRER